MWRMRLILRPLCGVRKAKRSAPAPVHPFSAYPCAIRHGMLQRRKSRNEPQPTGCAECGTPALSAVERLVPLCHPNLSSQTERREPVAQQDSGANTPHSGSGLL